MNAEKTVRDAAQALQDAIAAAQAQGYVIAWPSSLAGLSGLVISQTDKVVPEGSPLNLTDEERAALPVIDPNASNDPETFVSVSTSKSKK